MIETRALTPDDRDAWASMREQLWPDDGAEEHRAEVDTFLRGERPRGPWEVLVAVDGGGRVLGFVEVSVRAYAEGCRSTRVGYLEGWFVIPAARGGGVGRALVAAAERWVTARGCDEFASDADPENVTSVIAHRAVGFEDAGLVRCFRKDLAPPDAPPAG